MSEIFFVLKVFVITIVFVLCLQIKVGDRTIDQSLHHYLQESSVVEPLQKVAKGGVIMIEHAYQKLLRLFDEKVANTISQSDAPGNRRIVPQIKRHYDEKVKEPLEDKAKEQAIKFRDRLIKEEDY